MSTDGETPAPKGATKPRRKKALSRPDLKRNYRRAEFTAEIGDLIIEEINRGNYPTVAAEINGVDRVTLMNWLKEGARVVQGRVDEPTARQIALSHFWTLCARARAKVQGELVRDVRAAAKEDFRAAAWLLERSFRADWMPSQAIEVSGPDGGPIRTETKVLGFDPSAFPKPAKRKAEGGEDE